MEEEQGYGNCTDCVWYKQPEGCNVKRGSRTCDLNRKPRIERSSKPTDVR